LAWAGELRERFGASPSIQFATPVAGTPLARLAGAVEGDCGPRFQGVPSATDPLVPPSELARFRWSFEQAVRAAAPEKLIVNLTYRCNNHCTFCAVGNRLPRNAETAAVRRLLERSRSEGVRLLDLDGGEPTLHPDLLQLIGHARGLGYEQIAVTTNGRRLAYGRFARALARSGVTTVLVSLHGPSAGVHGAITSVPESFEQTVAGIRNLVDVAPPWLEVGVNTTVARQNVDRLGEIAALVEELGVRRLTLQLLTPFGRATREQTPELEAAAGSVARVLEEWGRRLRVTAVNVPVCMLPGWEESVLPDAGKLTRRMAFVDAEEVNLAAYLAERRVRRPSCAPCAYAACCAGFYETMERPDPPWPAGAIQP
jgi:MoaA/NifB/PqqE/SkfB family radical SAM enzyme